MEIVCVCGFGRSEDEGVLVLVRDRRLVGRRLWKIVSSLVWFCIMVEG